MGPRPSNSPPPTEPSGQQPVRTQHAHRRKWESFRNGAESQPRCSPNPLAHTMDTDDRMKHFPKGARMRCPPGPRRNGGLWYLTKHVWYDFSSRDTQSARWARESNRLISSSPFRKIFPLRFNVPKAPRARDAPWAMHRGGNLLPP